MEREEAVESVRIHEGGLDLLPWFHGYPSMQVQVFIKTDLHGSVSAFSKISPRELRLIIRKNQGTTQSMR